MAKFNSLKPLTVGMGAALVASALASTPVNASENPFASSELPSGYLLADGHKEGGCGEGKCGGDKGKEEGKCGGDKGKGEGKCGEGKCGG